MNDDLMGLFYNGPVEPTLADLFSGTGAIRPAGGRLYGASRQPTMSELFSGAYPQGVSDRPFILVGERRIAGNPRRPGR